MDVSRAAALIGTALLAVGLAGCTGDGTDADAAPSGGSGSDAPTPSASSSASALPTSEPTDIALPTDCRAILSDDVLDQLAGVPLNDPDAGTAGGVQDDGSLVCVWQDPQADTTSLVTRILGMSREPALETLNELADDEGFTCYSPDAGVRCEKTWTNEQYPVEDGRTLYWRDGVLVDTRYSNLSPDGYTAAIVERVFPQDTATPTATPTSGASASATPTPSPSAS